jgi:hypothetical protein
MDKIKERFRGINWRYAPGDPTALAELDRRIRVVGLRRGLITYSDLVNGVIFNLASPRNSRHQIDVTEWQDLDRAIIGDYLGYLSMESYEKAGFLASALAVSKQDGSPSEGFYNLLKELELITSSKTDKALYLWADHVAKAHTWYSNALSVKSYPAP